MNYTDIQLKQALAKMLPEKVHCATSSLYGDILAWTEDEEDGCLKGIREVLDTELLHLCWLVEETLTNNECDRYSRTLSQVVGKVSSTASGWFFHATWQQRTLALAKTLGIEIL